MNDTFSRRTLLGSLAVAAAGGMSAVYFSRRASLPPLADWPSHGWGPEQTRHNLGERTLGAENVGRLVPAWEFQAEGGITGTPAVVGERVIVGSWDGRVYALDRLTGKRLWTFDATTRTYPPDRRLGVFASPAVWDDTVYVASDRVLALDLSTGRLKWERVIGDPEHTLEYFWASPLVRGGLVYAGVSAGSETVTRGQIVALDAATGKVRWSYFTVDADAAGGCLMAAPSLDVASRTLYAATCNPFRLHDGPIPYTCSLVALDADSGALRWADQVHPHDTKNLDLNCPPMLAQDVIVVGGKDGLRGWDRAEHKRLWHIALSPAHPDDGEEALPTTGPEAGPTALADGVAFFASNIHEKKACELGAIDAKTGDVRWQRTLPAFQFGPVSVANGVVYIGLVDGKVRAFGADKGEPLWESPHGPPIAGGIAIAHGMVFVGSGAGQFLPGSTLRAFGLPGDGGAGATAT